MPKRLIDDSYLNSPSMAVCSPRAEDAYPRFMLLADDFGCFEVNPRALLARGWPNRTDVTEQDLISWLEEYVTKRAIDQPPVAMIWSERGRRYCYLTGWDGPHGQRKRVEYKPNGTAAELHGSKRRTPAPPPELLRSVMAGAAEEDPPGLYDFQGGKLPETAWRPTKNSSVSTPGRETTGKPPGTNTIQAVSRPPPAHAVPDPDPVAIACLPVTGSDGRQDAATVVEADVFMTHLTAARARQLLEQELGRPLIVAVPGSEEATSRRWVELVEGYLSGVSQAEGLKHFVRVCNAATQRCLAGQRRRKEPETGPESLAYFLGPLADGLAYVDPQIRRYPSVMSQAVTTCPTWGKIVSYLEAHVRRDLFERWFMPLHAEVSGSDLILSAPDGYFAQFLRDNYQSWLQEIAARVGHVPGELRIETHQAASQAAGVGDMG